MSESKRVWFITGCSSGFGRALAECVLAHGERVVVTARNLAQIEDLAYHHPQSVLALTLDVTDAAQVADCIAKAEAHFGAVDVLVNNAGYGYLAAVEEGEDHEVRAMFETNFFGLVELIKQALPGMRARKRGHIVNVSSVGGLIGNPASGYYNATKFAVEGLSEALAKEVAPHGIRVTIIEPGPFRTDWSGRSLKVPQQFMPEYADTAGARRAEIQERFGKQPGDPVRAADAIIEVVESDAPPLNLVLGENGYVRVRDKVTQFLASLDQWKTLSLSADYPKT